MGTPGATRGGPRGRLLRELLPIGAAAGAAAVAVTLVVGGTTAELVSPAQQGPWPVATNPGSLDAPPAVVTNAPAPKRPTDRARAADIELAGPFAIVTGTLGGSRSVGLVGGDAPGLALGGRAGASGGSIEASELAAPVLVPVAPPVVPVEPIVPVEPSVMVAASAPTRPGKSGSSSSSSKAPASKAPRASSTELVAAGTMTAAGAGASSVEPAQGDTRGQGRGNGPESAPGQARAAERSSRSDARSQTR